MATPEVLYQVFQSKLTEDQHVDLENYLALVLSTYDQSKPPGYSSHWRTETDEDGFQMTVLDCIYTNDRGRSTGLVSFIELYNPYPNEFAAIVTSRTYISPAWRNRGLVSQHLSHAIKEVTEFRRKNRTNGRSLLPVLLVENIVIPDGPEYAGVKEGVRRTLTRHGYQQAVPEDPDFFFVLV